jgi:hypothetical protein
MSEFAVRKQNTVSSNRRTTSRSGVEECNHTALPTCSRDPRYFCSVILNRLDYLFLCKNENIPIFRIDFRFD